MPEHYPRLTASNKGALHLTADSHAQVEPEERRTVTGIVVPWDAPGHTSAGPVSVSAGAVELPEDLTRVKLLRDHSTQPGYTPVGHAVAMEATPDGLLMKFRVGDTPDGDAALADVSEGIRDALSVELIDTKVNNGSLVSGTLTAVALVAIPAFADARVTSMTASQHPQNNDDGKEPDMPKKIAPNVQPAKKENATPGDAGASTTSTGTTPPAKVTAASVPSGLTVHQKSPLTFSQAVGAIAAMQMGTITPDVTAALSDITRSANPAVSGDAWLGEMWEGAEYVREIVPTMTQATLTRMKGIGWRWDDLPEVDDYAGDKAEVPSNDVSTVPVEVTAKRLAAGHDIDRAYFDFAETEFLDSFFRARANDYAMKTDTRAATFIAASATTGATVAPEPDLLHAAARARLVVKRQTRVEPSAYLVHPDDLFGLFSITQLDNPAYLDLLGVSPEKFIAHDLATPGHVTAYAKQAVTFFELAGSPIRVDAERISHGGIDSGIFGYYATLLNQQRGIVQVPFGDDDA